MRKTLFLIAAMGGLALASPSWADRIDGDWCSDDGGKHLTIDGPAIRTPTGHETLGDYERHAFRYDGVDESDEAGQDIRMQQYADDDMRLQRTIGGQPGDIEQWRRCKPVA